MGGLGTPGPAGFHDVRQANLAMVVRALRRAAPCSRADLAAITNLTKATTSSLVRQLIDLGLVREVGNSAPGRVGRPAIQLALDDRTVCAVGLEANVDYLMLVAADIAGNRLLARHLPFDSVAAGPEACCRRLSRLVGEAMGDPRLAGRRVLGCALAVPALVDALTGVVADAPNLGWRDFPARDRLRAHLTEARRPTEVFVDNDANLGVMAEYRIGHRAGTSDLVYLTGEVGVGAGILVEGRLLRGASGRGGEFGHIPLVPDGPRCGCGRRGCLEALAGIHAILRAGASHGAPPEERPGPPETGAELGAAVAALADRAERDARTRQALTVAGQWLGRGVATLINLLNPRAVILGGYFESLGDWLLPACRDTARTAVFAQDQAGCAIEVSTLGFAAAAQGAAASVIDALDRGALELSSSPRG